MGRIVTAVVTSNGEFVGVTEPFAVGIPWWSEVEPVVAHLSRVLDVPVVVLRLMRVEGGEGGRDGHVTYHVEASRRPASGLANAESGDQTALTGSHELRSPWARLDGLTELLDWATDVLAAAGRPVTGPVEQRRTWNLAGLFRLPTRHGPVWLKATPHFATDEAAVIDALARVDPGLVPTVLATGSGRILMEHLPGTDCWQAPPEILVSGANRLVAAQAGLAAGRTPGLPVRLPARSGTLLADLVEELLDGPVRHELTTDELAAARGLVRRWPALDDCGLPDTLVHGDFHPGNLRSDGGPPVVLDFSDAYVGSPVLDGVRLRDFARPAARPILVRAWIDAWARHAPGSDPARALAIAEPLTHLAYAVRYQEFLDGIEPAERVYHLGDPATEIRAALRCA